MEATSQPSGKRVLGDEWADWDGREVHEARAGKRLFLLLCSATLALAGALALLAWYMIAPRLLQWHSLAPLLLLLTLATAGLTLLGAMALLTVSLFTGRQLPAPLRRALAALLTRTEPRVHSVGTRLQVDRDRMAHSFVKLHNALERGAEQHVPPERLLVLLPRCLTKELIHEVRERCAARGVKVAVVPGGELARQRIAEHRPAAVIGVACERDLLGGLRDVRGRVSVLGIPNRRPNGPCKDTEILMDELEEALGFYLAPADRSPVAPAGATPTSPRN